MRSTDEVADDDPKADVDVDVDEVTRPSLLRRIVWRVVVVFAACTLVPTTLLFVFQDKFTYVTDAPVLPIGDVLPGGREIAYRTDDGIALLGWFVASRRPAPGCGRAPTAILFHGQGGNRSWEYPLANALAEHGVNVFIAEYRGFGGTEGTPSEGGITLDARAAADTVARLPEIDPARVIYLGYSLGTGVAVRLASERRPAGVILLAPYTSLPDVAWTRLPGIPYQWLMRDRFDSLSRIAMVDAPLLVVIGSADEIIPNEQSRRIYEAAKRPELFVTLDGQNHIGVEQRTGDLAIAQVAGFVSDKAGCANP